MEIFDTKYKSKKSSSANNFVRLPFVRKQRVIPSNDFRTNIDQMDIYLQEREKCEKIRLTVTVNPICTNALFNRITEVVYKEGSDSATLLNYEKCEREEGDSIPPTDKLLCGGKQLSDFTSRNPNDGAILLTRDTQLSQYDEITYHCGLDILNNHIARKKTFKCVSYSENSTNDKENFNTIADYMRDYNGSRVKGYNDAGKFIDLHLYLAEDIMTFEESVEQNLIEDNGWLGFVNTSNPLIADKKEGEDMHINKVINKGSSCDFINLCPEKELFYLTPLYNRYRNRFENNWNYCLTYPSSSTTEGIQFIHPDTKGLRIYYFDDEYTIGGMKMCKIVSCAKHGLQLEDVINLYFNGTLLSEPIVVRALQVIKIDDEYTFYVKYSDQNWVSQTNFVTWKTRTTFENNNFDIIDAQYTTGHTIDELSTPIYEWSSDKKYIYRSDKPNNLIPVFSSKGTYKANLSLYTNDVSFRQVVGSTELEYYVRIFSKIPNWQFAQTKINEYTSNEEKEELIRTYSSKNYDFSNHLSNLAFAKNIYGDEISQIVFTDDIDISNLTDNLGRPLTDIFITFIKNNAGYRLWYGKNGWADECDSASSDVEYSHVFGKVSCGFKLAPETVGDKNYRNIIQTNNVKYDDLYKGLDISLLNDRKDLSNFIEDDEIEYNRITHKVGDNTCEYEGDVKFYGDLCKYSNDTVEETVIDDVWFRFNTAQRELNTNYKLYDYLKYVVTEDIASDDFDSKPFSCPRNKPLEGTNGKEGYTYKAHYRIPIRSFSSELQLEKAHVVTSTSIDKDDNNSDVYVITTDNESYIEPNDEFILYSDQTAEYYVCHATKDSYITPKQFKFTVDNKDSFYAAGTMQVIKRQATIPQNAVLLKDGSYRYAWRELIQNGLANSSIDEMYPFTNGALYIEQNIRLYCQRQDPNNLTSSILGYANPNFADVSPNKPNPMDENNYVEEDDIICF